MQKDLNASTHINVDKDFIDSIFAYNVRNLEITDSLILSQYVIALSQYLIYFKSKLNENKVEIRRKQRFIDNTINQLLTKELIKEYKTKKDASAYLIDNTENLYKIQVEMDDLKDQEFLLDGVDKTISELIASFKRELTRRENEQWQTRKER
ncbi:MAG TPA: hypothetical protein VI911_07830 [Patescibacteria group bacterium]|nr:hypothetical protein [Patescibacteria group bacterium]